MLKKLTNPRLRRFNVVVNSFSGCVTNATKEFSRTPEMSLSKVISQPRMFSEKAESTVAFKQLKSFAHAHRRRKFNKQVDVINSDVQLINFASSSVSDLSDKKLTIHSEPIELKGIHCIFNFPDKMESILSEAVLPRFQIHFKSSETLIRNKVLTMLSFNSGGLVSRPSFINNSQEINLMEGGDSSQTLKDWVSSPRM